MNPVERVDYYSDEECQQEAQMERHHEREPDIVPCFICGGQMYQECHEAEGNICGECEAKSDAIEQKGPGDGKD